MAVESQWSPLKWVSLAGTADGHASHPQHAARNTPTTHQSHHDLGDCCHCLPRPALAHQWLRNLQPDHPAFHPTFHSASRWLQHLQCSGCRHLRPLPLLHRNGTSTGLSTHRDLRPVLWMQHHDPPRAASPLQLVHGAASKTTTKSSGKPSLLNVLKQKNPDYRSGFSIHTVGPTGSVNAKLSSSKFVKISNSLKGHDQPYACATSPSSSFSACNN